MPVALTDASKCVGCGTCALICPEPLALTMVDLDSKNDGVLSSAQEVQKSDETCQASSDACFDELTSDLADAVTADIVANLAPETIENLADLLTRQVTQAVLAAHQRDQVLSSATRHAFLKGNDAVICGALAAGCRAFFGYPITPASEIAHDAMRVLPHAGAITIQAESEVSAINMLYGAAASGERAMTATSGPGFSLMQEGISYMAAARLPGVIVDVMRSGPGLGNIGPEQGDYFVATRGGGHGHYHIPVYAPASVDEMFRFTRQAFETAFRYRTPVIVLADAFIGQVMETMELPENLSLPRETERSWAARPDLQPNVISSLELTPAKLEQANDRRFEVYEQMTRELPDAECLHVEQPKALCVAFGICARVAGAAQQKTRAFDLFRPITLWPFPEDQLKRAAASVEKILVVECNRGQMLQDIQRLLPNKSIHFIGHDGGMIPTAEEIATVVEKITH